MKIAEKKVEQINKKLAWTIIVGGLLISAVSIGLGINSHLTKLAKENVKVAVSGNNGKEAPISKYGLTDLKNQKKALTLENEALKAKIDHFDNSVVPTESESTKISKSVTQIMELLYHYKTKGNYSFAPSAQKSSEFISNQSDIESIFGAQNGSYATVKQDIDCTYKNVAITSEKLADDKITVVVTASRTMVQLNAKNTANVVYYGKFNTASDKFDSFKYLAATK